MSIFKNWFASHSEDVSTIDGCQNAQNLVSKYGYTLVCPEDIAESAPSSDPDCVSAQKVASKYGYHVTCPE